MEPWRIPGKEIGMNMMKSRLVMAAFLAMAWNQQLPNDYYRGGYGSPAYSPKRKKLKGWQKK